MQAGDNDGETTKIKDIRWVDDKNDKEEAIIDADADHQHLHHGKEENEREKEKEKEKEKDDNEQQQPLEGPPTAS